MKDIIAKVGLPEHICKALAWKAEQQGWTEEDVQTLVKIALTSPTIRIPRAFVINRIRLNIKETNGGKEPQPSSSGAEGAVCPDCHTYPCTCGWDPDVMTLAEFKAQNYGTHSVKPMDFGQRGEGVVEYDRR